MHRILGKLNCVVNVIKTLDSGHINQNSLFKELINKNTFEYSTNVLKNKKKFDFIIIGAGTAGCLLDNRLTNGNKKVLLLEAGKHDKYIWVQFPVGYRYCYENSRVNWNFKTQKEPFFHFKEEDYPRGKVLGGCSSINGMIYNRGQKQDFDNWANITGNDQWNWKNTLPLFKKFEKYYGGDNEWHSSKGELWVEPAIESKVFKFQDAFANAAQDRGVPYINDFNRGDNTGVGYNDVNMKNGKRCNAPAAFIYPIIEQRKTLLDIQTECHVQSLVFDESNKKCIGVRYKQKNQQEEISFADCEVILSAGAIGSPQILELSGVGNPEILQKHGIKTIHALNGVGENLQDHVQVRIAFKIKNAVTLNSIDNSIIESAKVGLTYLRTKKGLACLAPCEMCLFTKLGSVDQTANIQCHIIPFSLDTIKEGLHKFEAFSVTVTTLRPTSLGHVHILSKNQLQQPLIAPNFVTTDYDKNLVVEGIQFVRQLVLQSKQFQYYEPQPYNLDNSIVKPQDILRESGKIASTIYHPVGTCKMGKIEDKMAVVDSNLNVIGIEGLRIVDASIMPKITSGNTNTPTYMIAEMASELIKKKWKIQ